MNLWIKAALIAVAIGTPVMLLSGSPASGIIVMVISFLALNSKERP